MVGAGEGFRGPDTQDETVQFLSAVHNKPGNLKATSITGYQINSRALIVDEMTI